MSRPISDLVRRAMRDMETKFREPAAIVFSREGYYAAIREDRLSDFQREPHNERYMGLPYRVDTSRPNDEPVQVLDADQLTGAIRISVQNAVPIGPRAEIEFSIIGRALTVPQLCNIIAAWTNARDNTLSKALREVIKAHGRFE